MKAELAIAALIVGTSCSPFRAGIKLSSECDGRNPILEVSTWNPYPDDNYYVAVTDIQTGANTSFETLPSHGTQNRIFRQLGTIDGQTVAIALGRQFRATLFNPKGDATGSSQVETPPRCPYP